MNKIICLLIIAAFANLAAEDVTREQLDLMQQYHLTVPPIIIHPTENRIKVVDKEHGIDVEFLPIGETVELPIKKKPVILPEPTLVGGVVEVDDRNFSAETAQGIVFVDLYANWCGPCRLMSSVVESISHELLNVKFIKVDIEAAPVVKQKVGAYDLPMFALYIDGKISATRLGLTGRTELRQWIEYASNPGKVVQSFTPIREEIYVPQYHRVAKDRVYARGSPKTGW